MWQEHRLSSQIFSLVIDITYTCYTHTHIKRNMFSNNNKSWAKSISTEAIICFIMLYVLYIIGTYQLWGRDSQCSAERHSSQLEPHLSVLQSGTHPKPTTASVHNIKLGMTTVNNHRTYVLVRVSVSNVYYLPPIYDIFEFSKQKNPFPCDRATCVQKAL